MNTLTSCFGLLDLPARPTACPGCGAHAPAWIRVPVDGLRVLTHDGDLICPRDPLFGYTPVSERLEVAA